jgi:hypothetical protein
MAVWSYTPQEQFAETLVTATTVTHVTPASAVAGQPTAEHQRLFRLRYSLVDTATVNSMAAFYEAQNGSWLAFDAHLFGVTHRVRFDEAMTVELFQPGLARMADVVLVSQVGS